MRIVLVVTADLQLDHYLAVTAECLLEQDLSAVPKHKIISLRVLKMLTPHNPSSEAVVFAETDVVDEHW